MSKMYPAGKGKGESEAGCKTAIPLLPHYHIMDDEAIREIGWRS